MITGLDMALPLRDEGISLKQALDDDTRSRLRAACADVVNALFDSAALACDAQRHARTLLWLRTLRERGAAIIEALQADLAFSGTATQATDRCDLRHLLHRHFAVLDPQPEELALLEAVFTQRLLQAHPAMDANRGDDGDTATARVVARLRMGVRDIALAGSDGSGSDAAPATLADTAEATPSAAAAPAAASRSIWHSALLTVVASLALLIAAGPPTPASTQAANAAVTMPTASTTDAIAAASGVAIDPEAGTASPPSPDTHAATDPPAVPPAETAAPAPPAAAPAPAPQAVSDPRLVLQVEFLLRRADAALAALRLTEPFPDSAAANYTAVLALIPDNTRALEGLERIVAMYGRLVSGALGNGNVTYADELFQRARTAQPASALLAEIDREIAAARGSTH